MTPSQLIKDIQAGRFSPAYYFYGSEDYRVVEAEKYLASQFLPGKLVATNFYKIDGKRTPVGELMATLGAYPMLGERQLFVVSDFQHYKPKDVERILKLISPQDKSRIVIFSTPADKKPRKDSAFLKAVLSVAAEVEFKKLTEEETILVIRGKFSKADLRISADATKLIAERVAGDRGALESECDKLIEYKSGGEEVTLADVQAVTAGVQIGNVFEIGDLVLAGDTRKILEQFRFLIADGTSPTGILYFLGQHYLTLYGLKNGRSLEPYRRWLLPKFRTQAEPYDNQRLERILVKLAEADAEMRRGRVKPDILLEMLVLDLVGGRTAHG